MSSVIDAIVDVFEAVVAITLTVTLIGPILSQFSDDFKDWYVDALAPLMSLLGIEDEDVISAEVTDQRLLDNDTVKNLMTKIALDHQDTQKGIIELMSQYSQNARGSMTNYFTYGRDQYVNGLPNTNIKATTVQAAVYDAIAAEYGVVVNKLTAYVKVPTKEEYLYYKMNKLYEYQTWANSLVYSDTYVYKVKYMDYNYGTDNYDITIYRDATEETEVTITITPYDATQDNKNTHTVVTVHALEGDIVVSDTSVDELIPIGTETDSYTTNTIDVEYGTTVFSVAAHAPKLNYVVTWYESNSSNVMYWCYEIGSGNTTLDNAQRYIAELDMMPIVELRNNKINVNNDPTSELYLDGKAMLDYVGIDIDMMIDNINQNPSIDQITNAYVYFGIDLKDVNESDVVAKLLYHTFEYLYDQNLVSTSTQTYSAYTTEGNYNSTMIWRQQIRTVVDGVIGAVGTYKGYTEQATLVLRKQETPEQYVEYRIVDIGSTVFIKEGGLYATVARQLNNYSVIMPISRYIAETLSPIEQLEIFGRTLRYAIYSAEVTHLEWYQTSAFMNLIQIVIVIVAVVLFILTLPAGGSGAQAWLIFAGKVLASIAISYSLKLLLEQVDNPYIKAALSILAAIAMAWAMNGFTFEGIDLMTADTLITAVTKFSETVTMVVESKMEDLMDASAAFATAAERAFKELNEKSDAMAGYLDTGFVAKLATTDMNAYIEGVDLMRYRAVDFQYQWDLLKGSTMYENIYDYDKYYRIGVV